MATSGVIRKRMLPEGLIHYQLRAKHGRKHILIWEGYVPDWQMFHGPIFKAGYPAGKLRWYARKRGKRWMAVGEWFEYRHS